MRRAAFGVEGVRARRGRDLLLGHANKFTCGAGANRVWSGGLCKLIGVAVDGEWPTFMKITPSAHGPIPFLQGRDGQAAWDTHGPGRLCPWDEGRLLSRAALLLLVSPTY